MDILGWNIPIWLLLLLLLIFVWYWKATAKFGTFRKLGIIGPRPVPMLGTMYTFFTAKRGVLGSYTELYEKYKTDFLGTFMSGTPNLVIYDVDAAKQISVKEFNNFEDRQTINLGDSVLNRMLTSLQGEHWKTVRHHVSPAFSGSKLRKMTEVINQCGHGLVKNLRVAAKAGDVFECKGYTGSFTMDVIGRTAFSIDIDSQNDKNNAFVRAARILTDQSLLNLRMFVILLVPYLLPFLKKYLGFSSMDPECLNFFNGIVERSMKDRTEHPDEAPKDFLQMMMTSEVDDQVPEPEIKTDRSGKWTTNGLMKDDIIAQCLVFFTAGYSTVADTLSFTMYHLAISPEIQEKAYQEISQLLPDGADPDYDQVKKLIYVEMCLDETLRIYPPAPIVDRVCVKETVIKGVTIPKDMVVVIPCHTFHNDPTVWEDPDKFVPERFTEEAKESRHPFQYIPFGAGPRMCVAQRLAKLKAKIALVHIIRNFRLVKCDKTEVPLKMHHSKVEAANGIWLKLEQRD